MTEHELKTSLGALRPPEPSTASAGRALHRATIALRNATTLPAPATRTRRIRLIPVAAALAAACVAVLLALNTVRDTSGESPAEDIRLLAQLDQVFPGRINAVIINEGTAHIELSEDGALIQPSDQAVVIELVRANHRLRVLSYSGRQINLTASGTAFAFSPLQTNDGRVLLAGNDFVWSPDAPATVSGWTINARPLSTL